MFLFSSRKISNEALLAMIVDTLTYIRTLSTCKSNENYDTEISFLARWVALKSKAEGVKLSRSQRKYVDQVVIVCGLEVNLPTIREIADGLVAQSGTQNTVRYAELAKEFDALLNLFGAKLSL